jgi:hypothetical protein
MSSRTPTSPAAANYRLMRSLVRTHHKDDKVEPTPGELDLVSRVFVRAGGQWEMVFKGSIGHLSLLQKVIKVAVDTNKLSKSMKWV